MVAAGTMKPAQSTLATTTFGQSTQSKEDNMTKQVKAANDLLSKDIIYTYWTDFGQFGDKKTCTTGHYTMPVYTGQKEFLSYGTAHGMDRKMKSIMIDGINEFNTIFEKYEGFSIW